MSAENVSVRDGYLDPPSNQVCPITDLHGLQRSAIHEVGIDAFIRDPEDFSVVFDNHQAMLREHYSLMFAHQPERAAMFVARNMRNLSVTAIKAMTDDATIEHVLPAMRDGLVPIPAYLPVPERREHQDLYLEGTTHTQEGLYHLFMNIMTTWQLGSTAVHFGLEERSAGFKGALWKYFASLEQDYENKWLDYAETTNDPTPPFKPEGDLQTLIISGIGNNMLTAQTVLLSHQRSENKDWVEESGPYPAYMRRTALASTDKLLLPTTTNRHTTNRIVADPIAMGMKGGVPLCRDPLRDAGSPAAIIRNDDGSKSWDSESLKKGPRKNPGNCAGSVRRLPSPGTELQVDEYFVILAELSGGHQIYRDPEGRFASVQVAHGLGALVAEHTMYRRQPAYLAA